MLRTRAEQVSWWEPVLEMSGPGPVPDRPQLSAAAGLDEPGGHGADAVAERDGFAAGEVAGEAQPATGAGTRTRPASRVLGMTQFWRGPTSNTNQALPIM